MESRTTLSGRGAGAHRTGLPDLVQRSRNKLMRAIEQPWPAPLNGQRSRQELIRALVRALRPRAVFESGTYRGATTHFLHHVSGAPVYSAEKNPKYARAAARCLHNFPQVRVVNRDSRSALRMLKESASLPLSRVLFYLDAHWEADLPLRDEVRMVTESWQSSVIVIDDFKVPDDDGYGFDTWGNDQLSIEYLGKEALRNYSVHWPRTPSVQESGFRRGCVVLASPDLTEVMAGLPELRSITEFSPL
jgi:predicted O-methyltransferase YrrM